MSNSIDLQVGQFYRISNSLMVDREVRGKIVQCIEIPEKSFEKPRFRLVVPAGCSWVTYVHRINKMDVSAHVPTNEVLEDAISRGQKMQNFLSPILNPAMPSATTKNHMSESEWAQASTSNNGWSPAMLPAKSPDDPSTTMPGGLRDEPGAPMSFSWVKDKSHTYLSTELNRQVPRDAMVWIKTVNQYCVLRDTRIEDIKFVRWYAKGATLIRRYQIKDGRALDANWLDSFTLPGTQKLIDIRKYIDENILQSSELADSKVKTPFRVILKRVALHLTDFQKKYKPNGSNIATKSTWNCSSNTWQSDKVDNAWESLTSILDSSSDIQEFLGKSFANAMVNVDNALLGKRVAYKGEYPYVEVTGIWHNYNPDARCFYMKDFEKLTPFSINYSKFASPIEAENHPL